MNTTNCHICGQVCKDRGIQYHSTCLACAIEIHNEISTGYGPKLMARKMDPRDGDGFPINELIFMQAIQNVKSRKSCSSIPFPKEDKPSEGMKCCRCGNFNQYAEANQSDNKSHICYSCRH